MKKKPSPHGLRQGVEKGMQFLSIIVIFSVVLVCAIPRFFSPKTNVILDTTRFNTNWALKATIEDWHKHHSGFTYRTKSALVLEFIDRKRNCFTGWSGSEETGVHGLLLFAFSGAFFSFTDLAESSRIM